MSTENILKNILSIPKATEDDAYKAGFDCGKNGANNTNCGIQYFATKEKMQSWERGKKDAEKLKTILYE